MNYTLTFRSLFLPFLLLVSCSCSTLNTTRADSTRNSYIKGLVSSTVLVETECIDVLQAFLGGKDVKPVKKWGTGVIIKSSKNKSFVITAKHVVEGNLLLACGVFRLYEGNESNSTLLGLAKLVAKDKTMDVALLEIDKNLKVDTKIAEEVFLGERVLAVGFPDIARKKHKHSVSITEGVVATLIFDSEKKPIEVRFTAPVFSGNSGGGLFNMSREVVGIVVSMSVYHMPDGEYIPYDGHYYAMSSIFTGLGFL
jgi:S1-C subfamily serine protease